jgi:flagellar basal body L-ring protein FlgH
MTQMLEYIIPSLGLLYFVALFGLALAVFSDHLQIIAKYQGAINLRVAATVSQVLPNGNLVVVGRQQVRVNQELRDLQVGGIIRPQDIGSDNTVRHDRLAEARIAYGGRGTISDVQRPRYGQELLDIILPF